MNTKQRTAAAFGYVLMSARAHVSYRANLIGYLVITVVAYGVRYVFLGQVMELSGGDIGGWSYEQVVDFFFGGLLLGLFSWALAGSVNEFFRHVHLGRIEPFLTKPTGLGTVMFTRWINSANLVMAAVVTVFVAIDRGGRFAGAGFDGTLAYALSIGLGTAAVLGAVVLAHSLTFVLQRQIPVDYVLNELFRFAFVPSPAFRGWAVWAGVLAAPVVLGLWAPVAALQNDFMPLALLAAVSAMTALFAALAMRGAVRRFDGLGG